MVEATNNSSPLSMLPKYKKKLPCCTNRKAPWMQGTLDTTYREQYTEKEVPHEARRPAQPMLKDPTHKFDGTTTMGTDFKAWQVPRDQPFRPANAIVHNPAPFNDDSTYKKDFGPKEAPYALVRPKNAFEPNTAPFDGTTTMKMDFPPQMVPAARPSMLKSVGNIQLSSGPFEGVSAYNDTYKHWPASKREPAAPAKASHITGGAFDGTTMYRSSYIPKELGPRIICKPVDAGPQRGPQHYDELPSSEYKQQYMGKEGPIGPAPSSKPAPVPMPNAPFYGVSTSKSDYVPYGAPRGPLAQRPQAAIPTERLPFEGCSTYKDTFGPKEAPYALVRPKNAFEPNTAPFDGTTSHKTAYIPYAVPTVRAIAPQCNITNEKHPFLGQSCYKDDYQKQPPGGRAERKVVEGGRYETGPFDGTTTYQSDFIPKEIPAQERRGPECECDSDPDCVD